MAGKNLSLSGFRFELVTFNLISELSPLHNKEGTKPSREHSGASKRLLQILKAEEFPSLLEEGRMR